MMLFHVSPRKNDASILKSGILLKYHKCYEPAVWLVKRDLLEWAIRHVKQRHKCEYVTVWAVRLKARQVVKRGNGPYIYRGNVEPARIAGRLVVTGDGACHV